MSKINTDYSYLFELMFGTNNSTSSNTTASKWIKVSDLSSSSVQAQLRAAGINTNSNQYKTVVNSIMGASKGGFGGYTTISGIKNRMSHYDKDGDWINPRTGLAGLVVTDKNIASKNKIISIPESSRDEMFELTKREFLRENGVANGDTTKRSDVYTNLYRKMNKNDRLAAGHTLSQYERAYTQAFVDAVKAVNPKWKVGKPIPAGALDSVTRESVDNALVKSGNRLVLPRKSFDTSI